MTVVEPVSGHINVMREFKYPPFSEEHQLLKTIGSYGESLNAVRRSRDSHMRVLNDWRALKATASSDEMRARYALNVEEFLDILDRDERDMTWWENQIAKLEERFEELTAPVERCSVGMMAAE